MNESDVNWNDLIVFCSVAHNGSLSSAARKLGMNQPTVGRRIATLESALGVTLFEKDRTGYRLTSTGSSLLERAQAVSEANLSFLREVEAVKTGEPTTIRVITNEWMSYVLSQHLPQISKKLTPIQFVLKTVQEIDEQNIKLFDIAIWEFMPRTGNLITQCVGNMEYAVYGGNKSTRHGARKADIADGADPEDWWALVSDSPSAEAALNGDDTPRYPDLPDEAIKYRCSSVYAMKELVSRGHARAFIPVVVGECENDLVRLSGNIDCMQHRYWISYPAASRQTPDMQRAVKSLVSLLRGCLRRFD